MRVGPCIAYVHYICTRVYQADCSFSVSLSGLVATSSIARAPSFITTMKTITAFAVLALAATTWAVSPPGELRILLNTRAFMLTAMYSALSNSRMLKLEENLESIDLG